MLRMKMTMLSLAVLILGIGAGVARAQALAPDSFQVNYFAGANGARPDGTVRITNPGTNTETAAGAPTTGSAGPETADLCANIYVFRNDQQLTECCSCFVSPNGLRTLSIDFDLTRNPLTAGAVGEGVIKIVASVEDDNTVTPRGACLRGGRTLAASDYTPVAALRAWGTHNQDVSGGLQGTGVINAVTETEFLDATLSRAELTSLQTNCGFISSQGSGSGICTCGRGD